MIKIPPPWQNCKMCPKVLSCVFYKSPISNEPLSLTLLGCHTNATLINMHKTHKVTAEGYDCPLQGA